MKLIRLLGITVELLTNKRVNATELADKFEVSIRTIYRDIELINQSGIPVASFSGTEGGFEIMEGFFLTKQHFNLEEFMLIYQLLSGVQGAVGGEKFRTLMNKLSSIQPSLLQGELKNNIQFDLSATEEEKKLVLPIVEAIDDTKRISFSYIDASANITKRKIEPLQLIWEKGVWYVKAFCIMRKEERYFRLSRISNLAITDEKSRHFSRKPIVDKQLDDGFRVHLHFRLSAQPRVFEQFPGQCVKKEDHIEVKTTFYSIHYALSILLSYGSNVRVLSPINLKEALINELQKIQQLYRKELKEREGGLTKNK
ncbi:helix-turn-helix transcriptional regulator [Alkalihalobacillus sp. 1P02AB]|uniref:helix-turn-helix transcriptional regulator n=1 Tax=Alkalihalobacillus sp. 1P02AB TaxID=3132260 RepID=UPI0039A49DEC